jgi:hypothetical protein
MVDAMGPRAPSTAPTVSCLGAVCLRTGHDHAKYQMSFADLQAYLTDVAASLTSGLADRYGVVEVSVNLHVVLHAAGQGASGSITARIVADSEFLGSFPGSLFDLSDVPTVQAECDLILEEMELLRRRLQRE